jgi:hypothetical protein
MDKYLSALRSFFAASGKELVAFERYLALRKSGGNHCHINVIAVPSAAAKQAGQVRTGAAGVQLCVVTCDSLLRGWMSASVCQRLHFPRWERDLHQHRHHLHSLV